jgi:hypothetical protein
LARPVLIDKKSFIAAFPRDDMKSFISRLTALVLGVLLVEDASLA